MAPKLLEQLASVFVCICEVAWDLKMASPIFPASLLLLLLLAAWPLLANAQGQGICPNGAQPVAATLDPPSGTTGVDPRASSNYTITGALLDAVGSIEVLGAAAIIGLRNSTIIMFHIPDQRLRPGDRLNATVSLIPSNRNCLVRNLSVLLFPTCKLRLYFTINHALNIMCSGCFQKGVGLHAQSGGVESFRIVDIN